MKSGDRVMLLEDYESVVMRTRALLPPKCTIPAGTRGVIVLHVEDAVGINGEFVVDFDNPSWSDQLPPSKLRLLRPLELLAECADE